MMATVESWILSYFVNSLWQVPLLFVAGLVAARVLRAAGPEVEHRVWVGALLLQSVAGSPGLGTRDHHHARPALLDVQAGPVDQ